ncbi:ATP-binding protein [Candidatus Pacearchaeota archaeon]|nr:ATP-binding protein [Candidatus Pacearchaeota archaeon]
MDNSKLKEANPWWEDKEQINKDLHIVNFEKQKFKWKYDIISDLEEGIYSLRGPRQVGKTTWIKQKIKDILEFSNPNNVFFYSCDNIKDYVGLSEIIELFLELSDKVGRKYIFLDEIPYVSEWQRGIKHLYDAGKFVNCSIVLSGSHSIDIKRSVELLPGRGDEGKRHFTMLPLTFNQYLESIGKSIKLTNNFDKNIALLKINFKTLNHEYKNYLMTGGFIKIINEFFSTREISDASYDVYLKWIIGDLAKWELSEDFSKQIARRVMESYVSELSWSSIKSGTDIDSHHTISKYVIALEEMFVFNFLYKMDFNKKISDYSKSKKIYFSDPFIFSACYKWINGLEGNFKNYQNYLERNKDKISEGVILFHLINIIYRKIKSNIYDYKDRIYYWTNKLKTKEIDFIYRKVAFELKYREKINSNDYRSLKEFNDGYLITKKTFDKRTFPLPAFLILLENHSDMFLKD